MTSKSSSAVIFPLPSLSKSRNAFLKSEMKNINRVLPAQLCSCFKKMLVFGTVYFSRGKVKSRLLPSICCSVKLEAYEKYKY